MDIFSESNQLDPTPPVMAAKRWTDNSEMMLDLKRLRHIGDDSVTLDPTNGRGTWWKHWRPTNLITNSLAPDNRPSIISDFTKMPFRDSTFDVVAYDPPYVSTGGRKSTGMKDHQDRYGLLDAPSTPESLQCLINDGLSEMFRLTKSGGTIFVKCQDYVSSGKLWWGTDRTRWFAEHSLGMKVKDRLYYLNNGSAQPDRSRADGRPSLQQHARVNVSTLWVFIKR